MGAKVFWVAGPWQGRLGILPRPRGGDWLGVETTAWREAGIDVVVSLLEPDEEAQFVLEGEAAAAAASGVNFTPFPIPDRGVPASRECVAELANGIVDALETGRNVAVHCSQGIGRSGLIVGGVLGSLQRRRIEGIVAHWPATTGTMATTASGKMGPGTNFIP